MWFDVLDWTDRIARRYSFAPNRNAEHSTMALVSGYDNEIFISYSHIDNEPFGDPRRVGRHFS